jgi:hypothetical protein
VGLKIGRGGRVAAATVLATLLLSVALEPLEGAAAFQLGRKSGILKLVAEEPKGFLAHLALRANPSAQPAETGCSSPKTANTYMLKMRGEL